MYLKVFNKSTVIFDMNGMEIHSLCSSVKYRGLVHIIPCRIEIVVPSLKLGVKVRPIILSVRIEEINPGRVVGPAVSIEWIWRSIIFPNENVGNSSGWRGLVHLNVHTILVYEIIVRNFDMGIENESDSSSSGFNF